MPPPSSPDADADAVLDFLRRHGLSQAESALRAEMFAVAGGGPAAGESPPPAGVGEGSGGGVPSATAATTSSSSSDDDEFVSLGSAPCSDLINPYGVWTSSRAESAASSSDGGSDFDTAREYNDSYWYNEKGGFPWSPLGADKFVTNAGVEDLYDGPVEVLASRGFDYVKDISYLEEAFCDCCRKQKGFYPSESTSHGIMDDVAVSSISPYDCYDLSYTEPKGLDSPELTKFQLELENNVSELISWKESTMHYSHQSTSSTKKQVFVPPVPERELRTFDSFAEARISPLTGQFSNSSVNVTSTSYVGDQGKFGIQLRDYEHNMANGSSGLADDEETVEQAQISGLIADGGLEQETPTGLQMSETVDEAFEIFDLRIIHRKRRTGFEENKDIPIVLNTIIAGRYHLTEFLGSAAFSKVVQRIARQCLEALEYLHKLGVIHCDLKPENILIKSYSRCEIKVIDLGSSCFQSDNLCLYFSPMNHWSWCSLA